MTNPPLASANLPAVQPNYTASLAPTDIRSAMQLAEFMCKGKLVPAHLRDSPADMLMVIEQAMRWGMSPFAVAQCTSVIFGKLMFEGKLVAAAINSSGLLSSKLAYEFSGDAGSRRTVVARGTLRGEREPREVTVVCKDVVTDNAMWKKQEDQQLVYSAARVWARRHLPEVMLGIYSPEEMPLEEAPKRKMADISAHKQWRENECREIQRHVEGVADLAELREWKAEKLTPDYMQSLGNAQWGVEEIVARREQELSGEADRIAPNARQQATNWLQRINDAKHVDELLKIADEIAHLSAAAKQALREPWLARKNALSPPDESGTTGPEETVNPETGEITTVEAEQVYEGDVI